MARWLILDTEAVDALGGAGRRGTSAARALAIGRLAQREGARRVVPLPVLVEVYRGEPADAAIDRLVKTGVDLVGLSLRTVRLAGRLRNLAGTGSAVDAIVVATAIRLGGGIVATGDHDDLAALAANHPNVKVWDLTAAESREPEPPSGVCYRQLAAPGTSLLRRETTSRSA